MSFLLVSVHQQKHLVYLRLVRADNRHDQCIVDLDVKFLSKHIQKNTFPLHIIYDQGLLPCNQTRHRIVWSELNEH